MVPTYRLPMDVSVGDSVIGDNMNATLYNEAHLTTGIKDKALYLDGVNDYVIIGNYSSECFGSPSLCSSGFSMLMYLKLGDGTNVGNTNDHIYSSGGQTKLPQGGIVIQMMHSTDGLRCNVRNGTHMWKHSSDHTVPIGNYLKKRLAIILSQLCHN